MRAGETSTAGGPPGALCRVRRAAVRETRASGLRIGERG